MATPSLNAPDVARYLGLAVCCKVGIHANGHSEPVVNTL